MIPPDRSPVIVYQAGGGPPTGQWDMTSNASMGTEKATAGVANSARAEVAACRARLEELCVSMRRRMRCAPAVPPAPRAPAGTRAEARVSSAAASVSRCARRVAASSAAISTRQLIWLAAVTKNRIREKALRRTSANRITR
jgi:hypothetical protein